VCVTIVAVEEQLVLLIQCLCLIIAVVISVQIASFTSHISPHCLINGKIKKSLNKECVLISSTSFSVTFRNIRRIQRDITLNINGYSCQVHIILSDVNQISIFDRFSKILRRRI